MRQLALSIVVILLSSASLAESPHDPDAAVSSEALVAPELRRLELQARVDRDLDAHLERKLAGRFERRMESEPLPGSPPAKHLPLAVSAEAEGTLPCEFAARNRLTCRVLAFSSD